MKHCVRLFVGLIVVALAAALVHGVLAAGTSAGWVKQSFCVACHNTLDKAMVERYKATKHSRVDLRKVTPDDPAAPPPATPEKLTPAELYRRTVGFSGADNSFYEKGVGCQSCHGPGMAHMAAGTDPAKKKATMVSIAELKTPQEKLSVCGRCHGNYTVNGKPFVEDFKPGMNIFALPGFQLAKVTEPGMMQELNDFMSSKHVEKDVTCITCHTSHSETAAKPQLRKAVRELCLDCHATNHPCTVEAGKIPPGANCATCHMPNRRHTFKEK